MTVKLSKTLRSLIHGGRVVYKLDNVMVSDTKRAWVGNQFIKIDSKYRESKKERDASYIGTAFGLDMVNYHVDKCTYHGKTHNCCVCTNFLDKDEELITLSDMLNRCNVIIPMNRTSEEYFNLVCKCIYSYTGLDAREWLMNLIVFDFLIANSDRTMSDIGFIRGNNGSFRFAPIYDNDMAFFGTDSEMSLKQLKERSLSFKSKPFSKNPRLNLINIDIARKIAYGYKHSFYGKLDGSYDILDSRKLLLQFRFNLLG